MTETYIDPVHWVAELTAADTKAGKLTIWTVYDHPSDFPEHFVARRFVVDKTGSCPTDKVIATLSLDDLRMILQMAGLTVLMRNNGDDAAIVESWL